MTLSRQNVLVELIWLILSVVCDDDHATLPLEVHIISFTSNYYASSQGKYIPSFTSCF